jgi:predicted ATPase
MLLLMNSSGLIKFDYEERNWKWDLQQISEMKVSEDIAQFLVDQLYRCISPHFPTNLVPYETLAALRIAACFGDSRFNLHILSRVLELGPLDVASSLVPVQEAGLIYVHTAEIVHPI